MASALEISRRGKFFERTITVLVRPPILDGVDKVGQGIGRVISNDPEFESRAGAYLGTDLRQEVLLGQESQILALRVHDSREGHSPDLTADMALRALSTYVTAMAEGEASALRQFFPGNA